MIIVPTSFADIADQLDLIGRAQTNPAKRR